MPYKWNEETTLVFLYAYQKHPCLWNPYDIKYYNCLAKNYALKNIIKELNISELNISDCLEQIKAIRAKYGEEQIRIIKGLQSQKPYVSPFAWFPIIAGMLTKVINDEGKLQNRMKSTKTISHDISKNRVAISHDQNICIPSFPCAHGEIKEYNLETKRDFKTTPRENTKFTKAGSSDKLDEEDKERQNGRLDFLLCPSCGWQDAKSDKLNIAIKKAYELTQPDNAVPCPEHTNVMGKLYAEFRPHWQQVVNDRARYNNTVPCPSFPRSLSICTPCSENMPICHTYYPQDIRDHITDQDETRRAIVASKSKFCTRGTRLFDERSFPERRTRQVGSGVERCNKRIQNRICVSGTNVALPVFKCAILQTSGRAETDTIQQCRKEVRSKSWIPQKELKQAAINTVEQCDKEIQSTICVSHVNLSDSSKKVEPNSSKESETCEITKFVSATELRGPNYLEEKEKTNAVYIKTFLEIIKHLLILDDKKYIPNAQEEHFREEDSTKAFTILSEVKKCADKIFKIYTATDCSKKQLSNEFCVRYKSWNECLTKTNVASCSGILKNGTDQSTDSYTSLTDVKVLYKLAIAETKDHDPLGNYTVETATEKQPSSESKEIATHVETHDIGVSSSRVSLRDAETQYIPKQLRDMGVVSEHEKSFDQKISIGVKKREPISARAIECDKETCVHDPARITLPTDMINERKETYPALQRLSENAYRKYIVRKHYNEASMSVPAVSYAREKEVNLIDYHVPSLSSNKNYKYDENCRDALYNRNWRRINSSTFKLLSSRRISRIPLYARHKYIQRTNPHRISRSYM